jgi:hypothetical protein
LRAASPCGDPWACQLSGTWHVCITPFFSFSFTQKKKKQKKSIRVAAASDRGYIPRVFRFPVSKAPFHTQRKKQKRKEFASWQPLIAGTFPAFFRFRSSKRLFTHKRKKQKEREIRVTALVLSGLWLADKGPHLCFAKRLVLVVVQVEASGMQLLHDLFPAISCPGCGPSSFPRGIG